MKRILLLAVALAVSACDDENEGMGVDSSASQEMSGCESDQLTVSYFAEGDDEPADECQPWPEICDGLEDPCFDDDCISALYGLCEAPSIGAGCSSVGEETFVSCNE